MVFCICTQKTFFVFSEPYFLSSASGTKARMRDCDSPVKFSGNSLGYVSQSVLSFSIQTFSTNSELWLLLYCPWQLFDSSAKQIQAAKSASLQASKCLAGIREAIRTPGFLKIGVSVKLPNPEPQSVPEAVTQFAGKLLGSSKKDGGVDRSWNLQKHWFWLST